MTRPIRDWLSAFPGLRGLDALDRSVLVFTVAVWAMHYIMRTTLMYLWPGHSSDWGTLLARLIASSLGVATCVLIHVLLKRTRRDRPWRLLLMSLGLSIPACLLLTYIGEHVFYHLSPYYKAYPDRWMAPMELGETYKGYQWIFFAWCALYAAATNIIEVRRRDQQLAAAHSAAQQAQLLALRLQINPHFLFNTLNTLAGLIVLGRNAESEKMVLSLSRFLRYTLASSPSQFATLADEVKMLRRYLEIEAARFSDRLKVTFAIPQDCERALVPSLILLPLVENALKYGLGGSEGMVELTIGAQREGKELLLRVEDDGSGDAGTQTSLGIGLSNIQQRLSALYGSEAQLDAGPVVRGWRSMIRLPWHEEAV